MPLIVPGEADRNDLDFVYVLPELKSFRDGGRFTCNLGGGWLLDLHIYIDGTSSRRSRNNGEIKMPQKFLGRSTETSLASSWQEGCWVTPYLLRTGDEIR